MDLKPLGTFAETAFNQLNALPMVDWLQESQSETDKKRLKSMGNVVIPKCGELGMEVLLRLKMLSAAA